MFKNYNLTYELTFLMKSKIFLMGKWLNISLRLLLLHFFHDNLGKQHQKGKHSGFFWSGRWWAGSGTSWTICKSFAACCRETITPVPHHFRVSMYVIQSTTTTTILRPFLWDHSSEPVPEENFWTLWCTGRLTQADTLTIRLDATPSGLTSANLHHPHFFTGRMPFLPPNQQCQSTEGKCNTKQIQQIL